MRKTVIYIEGRRDAYSADELIGRTIKVGDLISILSQYDDDTPVMINNDNGYTFGRINGSTIDEADVDIDEEDDDEDD